MCLPCFERKDAEEGGAAGVIVIRDYNRLSFSIAALSLLFFPLAAVGGPVAIVLGIKGWRRDRRSGEALHPILGGFGLLLGLAAMAAGVLFWLGIFGLRGRP